MRSVNEEEGAVTEFRTIEIDFEVHKRIELERQSFAESPNAVLRRLLQITGPTSAIPLEGRPWAGKGVTLPHGTELRMEYNGSVHTSIIQNGVWVIGEDHYTSPSAAAGGVARTKSGKRTSLDGWIYWQAKRPGDVAWTSIAALRR